MQAGILQWFSRDLCIERAKATDNLLSGLQKHVLKAGTFRDSRGGPMLLKLAVVGFCLGSLAPTMAVAAPANTPKAHSTLNLDSAKKALESGDEARALAALDEIELSADRRAAPLVEALLGRGANSKLLLRAIGVAGALGAPSSSAALAPYVKHRAPDVRRAAAQSLARTKGSIAVSALRDALRGSDPALRSTAAEGLGTSALAVACAWVLGRDAVTSVVLGARDPGQLAASLGAGQLVLPAEIRSALDDVSSAD